MCYFCLTVCLFVLNIVPLHIEIQNLILLDILI